MLALIVAHVIWGLSPAISKVALETLPLFTFAFLRFAIPCLLLLPFVFRSLSIARRDVPRVVAVGFFAIFINITFFFLGVQQTASINASIIGAIGPVLLLLGSILFLKERPRFPVILGNLIAFAGALVIILEPLIVEDKNLSIVGNFFLLLATIGMISATLIDKEITKKYSPLTITYWSFVVGSIGFLPFFLHELQTIDILATLNPVTIGSILYGIFGASMIAYGGYFWSLKYIPASQVGIFTYITPIVAILVGWPLLGELPDILFASGAVLIFFGIAFAEGHISHLSRLFRLRRS
jgi:drug/metabolite transporter (DMT)-like permease